MSLYLIDVLHDAGFHLPWARLRAGPNSFLAGNVMIVFRLLSADEARRIRDHRRKGGRTIYVIDDNLEAITWDPTVPDSYRERIGAGLTGELRELETSADAVLVSSPALKEIYRERNQTVIQVDPFWKVPAKTASRRDTLEVAWLATRSHRADLESIAPVLEGFLKAERRARLWVWFGRNQPDWLRGLPGIVNRKPSPWRRYRKQLRRLSFDICLYPLRPTEFNRARSVNKVLEHACVDGAAIYSDSVPYASRLTDWSDCLLAKPGTWSEHLHKLAHDFSARRRLAEGGRRLAREISQRAREEQLAFWSRYLPLNHTTS